MKIEEFMDFRDRLNESLHYTFCTVEKMLHDVLSSSDHAQAELVMKSMEIKPEIDKINWSSLRDNRDLNVLVSYEPADCQLNDKTVSRTFENLKSYVKLRVLAIKCLSAVFYYVNDGAQRNNKTNECMQNGDSECAKTVLVRLVSELKCLYDELNPQDLDLDIQVSANRTLAVIVGLRNISLPSSAGVAAKLCVIWPVTRLTPRSYNILKKIFVFLIFCNA